MSNKAARNLFIFGSLFSSRSFLAMTFDTLGQLDKRAPEITEAVMQARWSGTSTTASAAIPFLGMGRICPGHDQNGGTKTEKLS